MFQPAADSLQLTAKTFTVNQKLLPAASFIFPMPYAVYTTDHGQ